jgi:hypothetical protein
MRELINRIDGGKADSKNILEELQTEIPEHVLDEAQFMSKYCTEDIFRRYKAPSKLLMIDHNELEQIYLNRVWRPNLNVFAMSGLPSFENCPEGSMPTYSSCRLHLNLPPNLDPRLALMIIEKNMT